MIVMIAGVAAVIASPDPGRYRGNKSYIKGSSGNVSSWSRGSCLRERNNGRRSREG